MSGTRELNMTEQIVHNYLRKKIAEAEEKVAAKQREADMAQQKVNALYDVLNDLQSGAIQLV